MVFAFRGRPGSRVVRRSHDRPPQALTAIGDAVGVNARYVGQRLPLAFLAPGIVEAIFAGTQPADLTAETLIERTDIPLVWALY
jgi:hypothetical protein